MLEIYANIPCYIMAYAEQLQIVKPAWNKKCIRHLFGDGYPIDRHPLCWRSDPNGGWLITPTAPPNMVDVSSKEIGFKWCIWMYMVYIYAVYCRDTYVNT